MISLEAVRNRIMLTSVVLLALSIVGATVTVSQENQTQIKKIPAPAISPASGDKMYFAYCSACHGRDGKGTALQLPR